MAERLDTHALARLEVGGARLRGHGGSPAGSAGPARGIGGLPVDDCDDPLVIWMLSRGLEVTREAYIGLAYGERPDPWTEENESDLPIQLQAGTVAPPRYTAAELRLVHWLQMRCFERPMTPGELEFQLQLAKSILGPDLTG
jgi:hypothetical protein